MPSSLPSLSFTIDLLSSVQSLSHVWLFATPWIAACQASLSITNSWSSLKLTSIESVMPSSNAGDPSSIPGSGRSSGEGIGYPLQYSWASLVAQIVKNLPAMQGTWVRSLGWADLLEEGMATHSSVLAWRIPGTGEPGGLPSLGSHRVGHDWSDLAAAAAYIIINYSHMVFGVFTLQRHHLRSITMQSDKLLDFDKLAKIFFLLEN